MVSPPIPTIPSLLDNLACLEALEGQAETAIAYLRRAIELRPETAQWARDDADFASLRDDPAPAQLVRG